MPKYFAESAFSSVSPCNWYVCDIVFRFCVTLTTVHLKWDKHINTITAKANQSLGFIKRNLKVHSPAIKEHAFKALVRPKLEYCNTIWESQLSLVCAHAIDMYAILFSAFVLRLLLCICLGESAWASLVPIYLQHLGLVGVLLHLLCFLFVCIWCWAHTSESWLCKIFRHYHSE
jgi:hypothetical protein